ncbi:fasciclin domain-containing protein [Armatimonas sp.]|uniref:fasciclin domain-containing protein n=1 Tax=Armatimonas sp. TaxID=1872638 RepID=UPI00375355F3
MKLKNRFIRLAAAFAIVGIVALQIPARPSVSLAQDGYRDTGGGLLNFQGAGGVAAGAVIVGAAYSAIVNAGKSAGGGTIKGAIAAGRAPIPEMTDDEDEYDEISNILKNSGQSDFYRSKSLTVFWMPSAVLIKALGASKVSELQAAANSAQAKTFLASLTVEGAYNINRLNDSAGRGEILKTLTGGSIALKSEGGKLTANGVQILGREKAASNGWIIAADGVVAQDE